MLKANRKIREQMKANNITVWMVAEKIGIHEKTLNGWFRTELTAARKEQVEQAIKAIEQAKKERT